VHRLARRSRLASQRRRLRHNRPHFSHVRIYDPQGVPLH
jgi:hypothetical protein